MLEPSPAGWYTDPFGRHEGRYWDGHEWTERVISQGRQQIDLPVDQVPLPVVKSMTVLANWYPDPFGRHEVRYWDGVQWTHYVITRGRQDVDPPVEQMTVIQSGRPNKKVKGQVHRSGASVGQFGGETLFSAPVLVFNQKAKIFGNKMGYAIFNQNGQQLGRVQELRRDFSATISDHVLNRSDRNRAHRFRVVDMSGRVMLEMARPQMGWLTTKAKLTIEGPEGNEIGQIVHESFGLFGSIATAAHAGVTSASAIARTALGGFTGLVAGSTLGSVQNRMNSRVEGLDKVGHARFGLESSGQRLGSVQAEDYRAWDFKVQDSTGNEIGQITKTWAGWAEERFTNADNYVVQMH